MSKSGALNRARALRDQLVARGVPTSIEIQQGRPGTPNDRWWDKRFIGSMGHHIVSRRSMGLTPGLALVKRGRSDVPGPLCNGYLGFDGRARIICMGWANHPGAGGSYTLPGGTIPRDAARPYLFGWEIEGGITEMDWPASFRIVMGKCHAATLAWLGRDERSHIEHKTWAPTRKIDRLNYTLSKARAELKPWLTITEEDDVDLTDRVTLAGSDGERYWAGTIMGADDISVNAALGYAAASLWNQHQTDKTSATRQAQILSELAAIKAAVNADPVDTSALAAELAPLVIPPVVAAVGAAGGLTPEQVEEAAEKALRDVLREGVDES